MKRPRPQNKYLPFVIIGLIIAAVVIALVIGGDSSKPKQVSRIHASACGPYRKDGAAVINGHKFDVEIAQNSTEFERGLGGRPCILASQAMLFSFTKPGQYSFWMKDMRFPIDILWVTADHKVAAQEIDVEPSTYYSRNPRFINDPKHLAQFVLEIKSDLSKQLNVHLGTPVSFQNT
jgi:uncharacterized membrane protein (UPF0127 family)